jgi:hypothetical protein
MWHGRCHRRHAHGDQHGEGHQSAGAHDRVDQTGPHPGHEDQPRLPVMTQSNLSETFGMPLKLVRVGDRFAAFRRD